MQELFGFKQVETNEHDFARYLRRQKAIDNYQTVSNSNVWYGPVGTAVAVCLYDNSKSDVTYWIPTSHEISGD